MTSPPRMLASGWKFGQTELRLRLGARDVRKANQRTDRDQRGEQQRDLDVLDDAVAGGRRRRAQARARLALPATRRRREWRRRARWQVPLPSPARRPRRRSRGRSDACRRSTWPRSACRPRTVRRRSRSAPCRCGTAAIDSSGDEKITAENAMTPTSDAIGREPVRVVAARQQPGRDRKAARAIPPASSAVSMVVAPTRQMQDLAAIGLEQNVLHAEGRGAETDDDQQPHGARRRCCSSRHASRKSRARQIVRRARRIARFLLPQRDEVQHHGDDGGALDHLDQLELGEIRQQHAEGERAARPCRSAASRRGRRRCAGACSRGARSVASARPAVCVVCMPAPTSRKARAALIWPTIDRPMGVAGQDQQRERHDREAAELQQRADPDIGHAPPAEHRAVSVGAVADQRAQRREHQRQRHHQRDQPAGDAELDDHDAVERAVEQHDSHADRDLEQRQPQQPAERQLARSPTSANGRKRGPSATIAAHQRCR